MRSADCCVLFLFAAGFTLLPAQPSFAQAERSDPWEHMNRGFFAVEIAFDRVLIGPVARSLGKTPSPIRAALRNITHNLREPLVAVNDLLQGHPGVAASTVGRFAINSIFGVAGIADVAVKGGIPHHDNGFGTTLGRWGVGPGPYLFLPLAGPSTVRDLFGDLADLGLDPLTYAHYSGQAEVGISTAIVDTTIARIDSERDLAAIQQTSTDPYATIRSFYLQNRQHEISGKPVELEPLPELDDTPQAAPAPAAQPGEEPPPAEPQVSPAEPQAALSRACFVP